MEHLLLEPRPPFWDTADPAPVGFRTSEPLLPFALTAGRLAAAATAVAEVPGRIARPSAPALPFATFPTAAFEITHGALTDFRSSADVTRSFCGRCSSPLTYRHDKKPDKLDIMTCSLDNADVSWLGKS